MPHSTFIVNLKQYKGSLPPSVQEEYLRADNLLDTQYISKLLKTKITESKFRTLVNNELGTVIFKRTKYSNEVTQEVFDEHYTFGRFPDARAWIGYFHRVLGLILTRGQLYAYITSTR